MSVTISVMYVQYFKFAIPAPLTCTTSFLNESNFKSSLSLNLIFWTADFIFNTCSIRICAASAARFLVQASENRLPAYDTGNLSPVSYPVAYRTTEHSTVRDFDWSSIDWLSANQASRIRFPFVLLRHYSSIPLVLRD